MTSLTDYAKNLLGRSVVGRRPALPSAVFIALGTGARGQVAVSVRYLEHVEACYLTRG